MIRRAIAAATLLLLAACGSTTPRSEAPASGSGTFPVTIPHKYGSTTIKSAPQRIVLVGLTEKDPLLALGIVPVATTDWLGRYESAINPWSLDKLAGRPKPVMLTDKD